MERDTAIGSDPPRRAGVVDIATVAIVFAIVAVCLLVTSQVRALFAVDDAARTHEQALVINGFKVTAESKRTCIASNVVWDNAVAHLDRTYDVKWATANIGKSLFSMCGLTSQAIISPSGKVLGAWREGTPVANPSRLAAVDRLISRLRAKERKRGPFSIRTTSEHAIPPAIDESVFAVGPEGPEIIHGSLVQPDFGTVLPQGAEAPIVIAQQPLDANFLNWFGEQYLLRQLSIDRNLNQSPTTGFAKTDLHDDQGQVVASVKWRYDRPVATLAWTVGPAIALLLFVIVSAPVALIFRERRHSSILSRAMNEAQAASEAKTQFIANMSHEIRTPLNGVLGILGLLRSKPLDSDTTHLVEHAYSSGTLLLGILNDVLDTAHVEAGRIELKTAPCDVAKLVHDIEHLTAALAMEKDLALACEIDDDLGVMLIDEGRLKQVLMNLISNAVKFTSKGGVTLRVTSTAGRDPQSRRLRISVCDTGVGIAPEHQAIIFRRFVQLDGSNARRQGGAGLGLAISQALIQLMGGEIRCDSQTGRGSEFWFEIECESMNGSHSEAHEVSRVDADVEVTDAHPVRILLVEDNPTNRLVACRILEAAGAVVETAINGQEGLQAATNGAFDVILMDVQMPEMDGVTATRRIRELEGDRGVVPIIGLTANVLPSQTLLYRTAGMNDVVAKPINPSILLERVHAAVVLSA